MRPLSQRLFGERLYLEVSVLRITVTEQTQEQVVLKLEGWLSGAEVAVLEHEGNRWLQQARRLVLDLHEVRFIDHAGIALLQRWPEHRLVLRGASPFVQALLEEHGLASALDLDCVKGGGVA